MTTTTGSPADWYFEDFAEGRVFRILARHLPALLTNQHGVVVQRGRIGLMVSRRPQ